MSTFRLWLFRVLVLAVGGLMVYTFLQPWWQVWIYEMGGDPCVKIYPYGLWLDFEAIGTYIKYLEGYEMPVWFTPAMWIYLGLAILALLFSLFFAKNKELSIWKLHFKLSSLLIGLVGFSYIVVVILAYVIADMRSGEYFNMNFIGYTEIVIGGWERSGAEAGLLIGYWLACAVGPLLLILASLRSLIIGKK